MDVKRQQPGIVGQAQSCQNCKHWTEDMDSYKVVGICGLDDKYKFPSYTCGSWEAS